MNIVVINRADRPDRLEQFKIEMSNKTVLGDGHYERFDAIMNKIGWQGCRDSHLAVLTTNLDVDKCLIFEDDVLFILNPDKGTYNFYKDLPSDWDMLYLGCSPQCPQERYSEHLYKINNAKTTHAILWHNRPCGAVEYILSHKDEIKKFDDYLCEAIHPRFNCFATYPILATQRESRSDIARHSDVSTIVKNFNKYCP